MSELLTGQHLVLLGIAGVLLMGLVALLVWAKRSDTKTGTSVMRVEGESSHRWATLKDLENAWGAKAARRATAAAPDPRRPVLGTMYGREILGDTYRSILVMAPTGGGKTPRVVVPTVLRHTGPAVVASVKADVLALTRAHREQSGPIAVLDPDESMCPTIRWTPLTAVKAWTDALDAAEWIQQSSKADEGRGLEGQQFWDDEAKKLLAPLLLLVARAGGTMTDVLSLIASLGTRETDITANIARCDPAAARYWTLFVGLENRTKTSVVATASNILQSWTHPRIARAVDMPANDPNAFNVASLLDSNSTLYLVAPLSAQHQFNAVYETMVNAILMEAERRYARTAMPLPAPLLLMLDEAANIAPLRRLDHVVSAMAGMGIITVTVWQNEGQIEEIYGATKARVIVANHTARIYMSGISDQRSLQTLSDAIGKDLVKRTSSSTDGQGRHTTSTQWHEISVAPPQSIREMPANTAIVISGSRKPMRLTIDGWFESDQLRALIPTGVAAEFDRQFAPTPNKRTRRHARPKLTHDLGNGPH